MISTVTTSTVATITTATATLNGLTGALALVAVLTLLALLVQKEIFSAKSGGWHREFARGLNVGIVPLTIAFTMILASRLAEAVR
ncbi:MAG: hypothetical protein NTZ05_23130 [Chloroflexi bacterium]|nr:hypothetical protein [Chloroflexota bacterium]